MKVGAQILVVAALRMCVPLIVLLAMLTLAASAPGGGVGFVVGLAIGVALILHALVFGAEASRRAVPPVIGRAFVALGILAALIGAGAPALPGADRVIEAGALSAAIGAAALVVQTLFGRVPTLRGEDS